MKNLPQGTLQSVQHTTPSVIRRSNQIRTKWGKTLEEHQRRKLSYRMNRCNRCYVYKQQQSKWMTTVYVYYRYIWRRHRAPFRRFHHLGPELHSLFFITCKEDRLTIHTRRKHNHIIHTVWERHKHRRGDTEQQEEFTINISPFLNIICVPTGQTLMTDFHQYVLYVWICLLQ